MLGNIAGQDISGNLAAMNLNGGGGAYNRPRTGLYLASNTAANSVPNGVQTVATMDTLLIDENGGSGVSYDISADCVIAPSAGQWYIEAWVWSLCDYYGAVWANDGVDNEFESDTGGGWATLTTDQVARHRLSSLTGSHRCYLGTLATLAAGEKVRATVKYGGWGGSAARNGHFCQGSTLIMWPYVADNEIISGIDDGE